MTIDFNKYNNFIFDCDGVILDSNHIKTGAFFSLALPFGEEVAKSLVEYHIKNGGVSRYLKIKYLLEVLLKRKDNILEDKLIKKYGEIVYHELINANYINGFIDFIKAYKENKTNYILSGGDQKELIRVFKKRNASSYFSQILGSPTSKYDNVKKILSNIQRNNTILFGDSKLDYEVANFYGFDFLFLHGKSEFRSWKSFFNNKKVLCIKDWKSIL